MADIKLHDIDTKAGKEFDKDETKEKIKKLLTKLDEQQNLLYAEKKHSLLVVIQGMDASGKDGAIRNIFGNLNPQGVLVQSFKVPTPEESSHDFLWRIHQHAPANGMIQVFNRSHYEDVLVTRVHKWCDDETAGKRMKAINDWEELITQNSSARLLKFYLHVSREEQRERLEERMKDRTKMWKYDERDFAEAGLRDDYIKMYEDCFAHCNRIPWTIVPSDQNWYKEYVIADKVYNTLKDLDMTYPNIKI